MLASQHPVDGAKNVMRLQPKYLHNYGSHEYTNISLNLEVMFNNYFSIVVSGSPKRW